MVLKLKLLVHAVLAVALFLAVVGSPARVDAAQLVDTKYAHCVGQFGWEASAFKPILACNMNLVDYPEHAQTPGAYAVSLAPMIGSNHLSGSSRYFDSCTGTTTSVPFTAYYGPTTSPYGEVGPGQVVAIMDGTSTCAPVLDGVLWGSDFGTAQWDDVTNATYNENTNLWSGNLAAHVASFHWAGYNSGAVVFDEDWYVNPGVTVTDCSNLSYVVEMTDPIPLVTWSQVSSGTIWSSGNNVRVTVDSSDPPLNGLLLKYRFSATEPGQVLGMVASPTLFPVTFDAPRDHSSAPVSFAEFEIECSHLDTEDPNEYWSVSGGASLELGVAACSTYTYSYEYRRDNDPGNSWLPFLSEVEDFVETGDGVRVTVDTTLTPPVPYAAFAWRLNASSAFVELGSVAAPSVFPVSFETVSEAGGVYGLFEVRCTAAGGGAVYTNVFDGQSYDPSSAGSGGNGEGCYRSASMTLTKPWTWVSGAGRMGVCLVEFLVVPDPELVDGYVTEAASDLEGQFPFTAGFMAADFAVTAVDSIAVASPCFAVDIDVPGVSTPCLDSGVVTTGGGERSILVVLFIGMLVLGVLGASWSLVSRRSE